MVRSAPVLGSLLASMCLMACGSTAPADAGSGGDAGKADAGADAGAIDAGATDAGTWATRIQPLLWAHCADCHGRDAGQVEFVESYAVTQAASRLCPSAKVGTCVSRALQAQVPEGSRCRTVIVEPFHREGWLCLQPVEIEEVVAWVDGGMPE
jgi:hypothetical protein